MERHKRKLVFPMIVERQVSAFVIKNFQILKSDLSDMDSHGSHSPACQVLCANTWCFHENSFSSYIVWHQGITSACRTILVSVM
jgi:hypothetical protein